MIYHNIFFNASSWLITILGFLTSSRYPLVSFSHIYLSKKKNHTIANHRWDANKRSGIPTITASVCAIFDFILRCSTVHQGIVYHQLMIARAVTIYKIESVQKFGLIFHTNSHFYSTTSLFMTLTLIWKQ